MPPPPPPPSPDDPGDDPEKRKRDTAIDDKRKGVFAIDSDFLRGATEKTRGRVRCEVEKFEQGTEMIIRDWIFQIETYFKINEVPPKSYVGFISTKIAAKHLTEIRPYQTLDYL